MASLPFAGMIQIRFKGSSGKKDSQFKNAPSDHAKIRLFHIKYKSSFIDRKINENSIHFMKLFVVWRLLLLVYLFEVGSCTTAPLGINPYFEMPPEHLQIGEQEVFSLALHQQKNNKLKSSIDLWSRFLVNNPRSFRGYNNLGMVYYANGQLSLALSAFETGLDLEPFDQKIKENLKRTLRFQVTLLRENKDYDAAIQSLKRIAKLSEEPERKKVALQIQTMVNNIFEQVKKSNSLEEYEIFLARYPNSLGHSDEARRRIERIKSQKYPMVKSQ